MDVHRVIVGHLFETGHLSPKSPAGNNYYIIFIIIKAIKHVKLVLLKNRTGHDFCFVHNEGRLYKSERLFKCVRL